MVPAAIPRALTTARRIFIVTVTLAAATFASASARAASLTASLDRQAVAPGEPFVYELRLTLGNDTFEELRPPDFRGFRLLEAPRAPSQSTQVTMMGGQMNMQQTFTWQYQLELASGQKGPIIIGAAHARVGGSDVASNSVTVRVGASGSAPPPPPPGRVRPGSGLPRSLFDDLMGEEAAPPGAGGGFIRAVADKQRAFVGEQVTVSWYLYVTQPPGALEPRSQPRTDGFWSEDIPSTTPQGRLAFRQEVAGGRAYQVATLMQKALFPLAPGKLTVTPFEIETASMDFFGRAVPSGRLKSEPLTIEAVPLPREGQPPGFSPTNVGHYALSAIVDRRQVTVGDAVTLTLTARGDGNVRNLKMPELPASLPGWKSYDAKTDVHTDAGPTLSGSKSVEWLLRPERAGKTVIPAFSLATFDPEHKRYQQVTSEPIEVVVTGDGAMAASGGTPSPSGAGPAPPTGGSLDTAAGAVIRPIRTHSRSWSESSMTLGHGPGLAGVMAVPPLAFVAFTVAGRLRRRLGADSDRTRRRRARSLARQRLAAAETHRAAGNVPSFYLELDRVLRERLAERLRVPVGALRLDELVPRLVACGFPPADAQRLSQALRGYDEARFAPAGVSPSHDGMAAALAEAEALIDAIDRATLTAASAGPEESRS